MKSIQIFLFLVVSIGSVTAQVSPKRGMAYGYHSVQDLDAVKPGISWWYNWSSLPDAGIAAYYASQGVEFVPMVWNDAYTVAGVIAQIPNDAKYLLAFNEPNFTVESNMTPAQAVAAWPKIEAVAAAKGLEIISAVPAYCGGGVCIPGYTDPVVWHNEFFALCPTCKVDYIAFHNYEPTVGALVALTNNLKVFNRPIWVTEFAYWDVAATEASKITYLQNAVNAFENDPDIYRYSWFAGRNANTTVSILGANGALTPLGSAYVGAAYGPINAIPGTVQAENQYRRRRTGNQACADAGGGLNVGFTDPGTWNEYLVNITTLGSYSFNFRAASNVSTGSFNILLDGVIVKSNVTIPSTGGWQTWSNVLVTGVPLTAGQHLIKFQYTGAGTNINYFTTVYESSIPPVSNFSAAPLSVCVGNTVTFTDQTTFKSGGETYAWNFGAGAIPATQTGIGPHVVSYTTGGVKTIALTVTNAFGNNTNTKNSYINVSSAPTTCLFSDDFSNNTVNWLIPIPGAYTHAESGTNWTISNAGYGEWEWFRYALNNGVSAVPINFQCASNKPVLKIRAKASAFALLNVSLMDPSNRTVDNYAATNLELTTTYQTFTIDFATHFRNYYGGSPGILDSSAIDRIQFMVNPGFSSYPITGLNKVYTTYFPGTIDIDWIGIGDATCNFALPVDLISFSVAKESTTSATVSWSTASELNNDFFVVQRSSDGIVFSDIATVDGAGTSTSLMNYQYSDGGLLPGTYYYRLKEVDFNGDSYFSSIQSVVIDNLIATSILPSVINSGDPINLVIEEYSKAHVYIMDITGKIYYDFPYSALIETSIQTKGFPSGVYLIKIEAESGVFTKKITIL